MRRYLSSDYFRRKEAKPVFRHGIFIILCTWKNTQTRFVESGYIDIDNKMLVANAVPESAKKSQQNTNERLQAKQRRVFEV